ncbi:MAG TPA: helix-turn-helix domain-containing protein [Sphingobacteriaceae bacterium]
MKHLSKVIIGGNVKALREALGLSQHDFSIVTDLSKRSIANIESGEKGYNLDLLDKILEFFQLQLVDISSREIKIPDDFRESIIKFHKGRNSPSFETLVGKPTIVYAIKYKLLKSTLLDKPREIKEIKDFFLGIKWEYISSSISNALKRMPDLIEVTKQEGKKNTFLYSRKK